MKIVTLQFLIWNILEMKTFNSRMCKTQTLVFLHTRVSIVTVQSLAAAVRASFPLTHLQRLQQSTSSTDPAMIPAAMNYAWDPGTDYPYQYAILITLVKLPLNSYEYVENVWDPYSPPPLILTFFFSTWNEFEKTLKILQKSHKAFSFLEIISLRFIRGRQTMHRLRFLYVKPVRLVCPARSCPRLHLWPLGDLTDRNKSLRELAQVRFMSPKPRISSLNLEI